MRTCDRCIADLLYCDVHDADFCPVCDRWIAKGCGDPECPCYAGRAPKPSMCEHDPSRHWNIYE